MVRGVSLAGVSYTPGSVHPECGEVFLADSDYDDHLSGMFVTKHFMLPTIILGLQRVGFTSFPFCNGSVGALTSQFHPYLRPHSMRDGWRYHFCCTLPWGWFQRTDSTCRLFFSETSLHSLALRTYLKDSLCESREIPPTADRRYLSPIIRSVLSRLSGTDAFSEERTGRSNGLSRVRLPECCPDVPLCSDTFRVDRAIVRSPLRSKLYRIHTFLSRNTKLTDRRLYAYSATGVRISRSLHRGVLSHALDRVSALRGRGWCLRSSLCVCPSAWVGTPRAILSKRISQLCSWLVRAADAAVPNLRVYAVHAVSSSNVTFSGCREVPLVPVPFLLPRLRSLPLCVSVLIVVCVRDRVSHSLPIVCSRRIVRSQLPVPAVSVCGGI